MELQFNKVGSRWEAEFEATGDFNLHVERKKAGGLAIYQKPPAGNKYATDSSWSDNAPAVVGEDFSMPIYPKMIKVVSRSEPIQGIVTMEGEGAADSPGDYPMVIKVTLTNEDNENTDESISTADGYKAVLGDLSWGVDAMAHTYVTAEVFYKKGEDLMPYSDFGKWEITTGNTLKRDSIGLVGVTKEGNRIVATYATGLLPAGDYAYVLKINDTDICRHYIYQI